jgi:hypothetical protein
MKRIQRISVGVVTFLLLVVAGCKSDYFDINNNPNQATSADPQLVLPSALANTGRYVTTYFQFLNLWMGYWNWSGNYSIGTSDKNYQFANTYQNGIWNDMYTFIKDLEYIDRQAGSLKQPLLQGMAKVMKAHNYQYLVDTYGNIPYSDAQKGTTSILPKYDDAKAVYDSLMVQLNTGMDLLSKGDGTLNPGANDILFHGNIARWLRFANTVKLRMLLRQSEVADRASVIQAELAKIKASGYGFLGPGENAGVNPGYTNSSGQQNPFWGTFGYGVNGVNVEAYQINRAGLYGVNFYRQTNDPRLSRFYAPVGGTGTTFNATYFGDINVLPNTSTSGIGTGLLQSVSQDAVILSSHESLFLQAEAAFRGWIAGDPKTLYQQAITESFKNVGVPNAEQAASDYYSQALPNVGWDATNNKLTAIITQKWASLNGVGAFQAWSDYRRLGIPAVPVSRDPSTTIKQIPVRLLYPQSEYAYNSTNVAAQGTISQFNSKIFWMK